MICLVVLLALAQPQGPSQNTVAFEVASVRPAAANPAIRQRGFLAGGPGTDDPGIMRGTSVSLLALLRDGYKIEPDQISGPDWLRDAKFDINATLPRGATKEQVPLMIQRLLIERFGLKTHTEMGEVQVYALTIAKGGAKLKETKDPNLEPANQAGVLPTDRNGYPIFPPGVAGSAGHTTDGVMHETNIAQPISTLAAMLRVELGEFVNRQMHTATVIDRTGLTGKYDYRLEFQPGQNPNRDFTGPTLIEAVEKQLGLKLEKTKAPVEMLILDHIERTPTEN